MRDGAVQKTRRHQKVQAFYAERYSQQRRIAVCATADNGERHYRGKREPLNEEVWLAFIKCKSKKKSGASRWAGFLAASRAIYILSGIEGQEICCRR